MSERKRVKLERQLQEQPSEALETMLKLKRKNTKRTILKKKNTEKKVGFVTHYFPKVKAGVIKITSDSINIGDTLHIKGCTTDFKQKVESMQIENKIVAKAKKGDDVGIKVKDKVRTNDKVYKAK